MQDILTRVVVKGGKPTPYFWKQLETAFASLKDGEYQNRLGKVKSKPSDPQRGWYFGQIVVLCAAECGYRKDAMHEILKAKHLPKDKAERGENGVLVGELVIGGSIAKLNRGEFSEYCSEIVEWAEGFLGVRIPPPDPDWRNLPNKIEEAA